MTARERKQNSENLLETLGITIPHELPPIEEESEVELKTPREIAKRILILTYLNCAATERELREVIIDFLKQERLWEEASEVEKKLFEKEQLSDEEESMIRWRAESIWMLLWTINKVDELDLPVKVINPHDVFARLPKFLKSTSDFLNSATIRPAYFILNESDLIFRLTWAAMRQAQQKASDKIPLIHAVAYERHYAINWVMSGNSQWDVDVNDDANG